MSDDIASRLRVLIVESRMTSGEKENALMLIEALAKREAVSFPRQPEQRGGYTVASDLLFDVNDCLPYMPDPPSVDQIEAVILALERVLAASQPAQQEKGEGR